MSLLPSRRPWRTAVSVLAALSGSAPLLDLHAQQAPSAPASATEGEMVTLSPFTVVSEQEGYQAANSLSGTRLNTKLEDIASSITVVTKLQLEDIAATDLNDVFLYEASTEGTGNYTAVTPNRDGGVNDDIAQNPTTANRIRGLGSANVAIGNFASNALIPVDMYNIDAIEISRGPNSNIFGLGNGSGTVNLVPAYANLTRDISTVQVRADDRGGFRSSFDFNRPLVTHKLALRAAAVYDREGFERKPAREEIRRMQVSAQAKPFANTTIKTSFERYHNDAQRPNSVTPREYISDWRAAGEPTWDPTTRIVTYADGRTAGPFNVSQDALIPLGLIGPGTNYYNRTPVSLEPDGTVSYWSVARTGNAATPRTRNQDLRLLQSSSNLARQRTQYPLFLEAGTTDQSIYDWTSVNYMAPNMIEDSADTFVLELEQFFIDSSNHLLAARAGYFRQKFERYERIGNLIGPNNSIIYIDVNQKNLDGTPNANFRRPYINSAGNGVMFRTPELEETMSADLVYRFTPERDNAIFGQQTVNLHAERRERENVNTRYSDYIVSDHSWTTPSNRSLSTETIYQYYVGDAQGGNVDYAPTSLSLPAGTYPFRWYNGVTRQWVTEQATLAEAPISNTRTRTRDIDSANVTYQGQFFRDRLITTVGLRTDKQEENTSDAWVIDPATGFYDIDSPELGRFPSDPVEQEGETVTFGAVVKVTPWLRLFYNWADSFTPEPTRYDIDGILMKNPTAEGQDFGVAFTLLEGKLSLKINRYEVDEINARIAQLGTIGSRIHILEGGRDENATSFLTWARDVIRKRYAAQGITASETQIYNVAATDIMKADPDFLRQTGTTGAVGVGGDRNASGWEVEATYNPTPNWRIKFNLAQQETVDSNIGGEITDYINRRLPVWTTAVDDSGNRWWTANNNAAESSYLSGIQAPYLFEIANDGKPRSQIREWRWNALTNYDFTEGKLTGWSVGGAVRWEDEAAIGFLGKAPDANGVIMELDPDRPVFDDARFHFDFNLGYKFKFAGDRVRVRTQLNVRDIFEDGRLQTVAVDPLGRPSISRIIDPRQIILTATFTF
ncbi:MAG TPA: TonB-dependent receptor plug domain-containing protein [Opitutaceae bacterium]